jgi:glutamate-1-semialdehyde 2,1-aminomutase
MSQRKPRSPEEDALLEKARRYLPAGVRAPTFSADSAFVAREGHGARLRDCSGNEYVDYLLGSGALILGHAHPAVLGAVQAAAERGSSYLMVNEPAIRFAEEIVRAVPCAEKVCIHSSGSESTFFAMRLARAFRKRDKILKFEGAFHGMNDYALMSNQWTRPSGELPAASPNSAGIPVHIAEEVLVAPFNDAAATSAVIEKHHDELAAVIVEPMQRTIRPRPGFLETLREVTERHGVLLVFDEMVTGFRLAYGGAQEYYGVVPDLCALGKSISGGHPISVLCGRADVMACVDPSRIGSGDHVAQTGTFSGNPISCTAALATLAELRREGAYERLFGTGRRLMQSLRELFHKAGIAAQVAGEPPAFEVWFTDRDIVDFASTLAQDARRQAHFADLLLQNGVLKAHEKFFVSTAHTDEDIEATLQTFEAVVRELKE